MMIMMIMMMIMIMMIMMMMMQFQFVGRKQTFKKIKTSVALLFPSDITYDSWGKVG